ncbi:hypothetical protein [Helicobacter pylori]|nr:hypothetical protein [Helicobacter pylori]
MALKTCSARFGMKRILVSLDFYQKTDALKPLAFSYGDTRRNAFRR